MIAPEWLIEQLLILASVGALILVLASGLAALLRRRSAASRHLVWSIAFASVLLLPIVRMVLPPIGVAVGGLPVSGMQALDQSVAETLVQAPVSLQPTSSAGNPATEPIPPQPESVLLLAWIVGASIILLQGGVAWLGLNRIRTRRSRRFKGKAVDLADLHLRSGVKQRWDLRITSGPRPPSAMTWGLIRPIVLLPEDALTWPKERLEAVLLHELAHVRRFDSALQMLAVAVCALYWFNPLVWLCARAMRAEAESAADDAVVRSGIAPSLYAEALVRIAAQLGHRRQPFAPIGVSVMKRSKIDRRIESILNPRLRRGATPIEILAIIGIGSALVLPVALLDPGQDPVAPTPAPPAQSVTTPAPAQDRAAKASSPARVQNPSQPSPAVVVQPGKKAKRSKADLDELAAIERRLAELERRLSQLRSKLGMQVPATAPRMVAPGVATTGSAFPAPSPAVGTPIPGPAIAPAPPADTARAVIGKSPRAFPSTGVAAPVVAPAEVAVPSARRPVSTGVATTRGMPAPAANGTAQVPGVAVASPRTVPPEEIQAPARAGSSDPFATSTIQPGTATVATGADPFKSRQKPGKQIEVRRFHLKHKDAVVIGTELKKKKLRGVRSISFDSAENSILVEGTSEGLDRIRREIILIDRD